MVPWQKLPDDLQKAVLALVVLSGSGAVASCRPMVCDPAPPPRMTPTPTMTPTSSVTPMICDPAPPPTITRHPNHHAHDLRSGPAADCHTHTHHDAGVNVDADDL